MVADGHTGHASVSMLRMRRAASGTIPGPVSCLRLEQRCRWCSTLHRALHDRVFTSCTFINTLAAVWQSPSAGLSTNASRTTCQPLQARSTTQNPLKCALATQATNLACIPCSAQHTTAPHRVRLVLHISARRRPRAICAILGQRRASIIPVRGRRGARHALVSVLGR